MSSRFLVVVTDFLPEAGLEKEVLGDIADLDILLSTEETQVMPRARDADILLVFHNIQITEHTLGQLTRCKGILRCGVGIDNIDLRGAGRRGIVVCNVPDYGAEEVADHALMMLLALGRRLLPADQAIRAGRWDVTVVHGTPRLRGRTLGLIGCGRIGTALALRAKALGLRVVFYDPYKPEGFDKALGVERCYKLEELLGQAEFLSLHCPLTPETHHILNPATLALLPEGAFVVNTARGPCIDPEALLQAVDRGQVEAAGLDVIEREPLDDERLRRHPRFLFTPHAAFYSVEGFVEMRTKSAREIRRMLLGEAVRNPVNLLYLVNPRCVLPRREPPDA
jgi:phosphoglycerate dehydrogenase-like enzyme